jgi:hypothetical protein
MTSILAPSRQGVSLLHLTAIAKSGHTRRVPAQLCDWLRATSSSSDEGSVVTGPLSMAFARCSNESNQILSNIRADEEGHWMDTSLRSGRRTVPAGGGARVPRGAFRRLLSQHPRSSQALAAHLNKTPRPASLTLRELRQVLAQACKHEGLGNGDYPLNTKSLGRQALSCWIQGLSQPSARSQPKGWPR